MRDMTEGQAMWVAGIVEGEGSIGWNTSGRSHQATINVTMTDLDVLQRLHDWTGIGNVIAINDWDRLEHWKRQWRWSVTSKDEFLLLAWAIQPYLLGRRAARLQEVLDLFFARRADVLEIADRRHWVCPDGHLKTQTKNGRMHCNECSRVRRLEIAA